MGLALIFQVGGCSNPGGSVKWERQGRGGGEEADKGQPHGLGAKTV